MCPFTFNGAEDDGEEESATLRERELDRLKGDEDDVEEKLLPCISLSLDGDDDPDRFRNEKAPSAAKRPLNRLSNSLLTGSVNLLNRENAVEEKKITL